MQYLDPDRVHLVAQLSALKNLKLNSSTGTSNVDALFTTATDTVVSAIAKSAVTCMLPQVVGLIKFYLMCPASSVTAERSFSQLHRLKTYLRSTMSQKWLNLLLIIIIDVHRRSGRIGYENACEQLHFSQRLLAKTVL